MSSFSCFSDPNPLNSDDDTSPPSSPTAAGKSDFSGSFKQTINRHVQNVATFLAPPPHQPFSSPDHLSGDGVSGDGSPSSSSLQGLKNDLAEIGGSFKNLLSSPKKTVTEITKFASNFLQFEKNDENDDDDDVGITKDVVDFVKTVSNRPECWIEFPLSLQDKDFNMSPAQKDHASAIEQLVPNLASLRNTVQNDVSEEHFWMIYFILLLPRLDEDGYRLLSTPEVVHVREVLLEKLRNKKNTPTGISEDTPNETGSQVIKNPLHQVTGTSTETGNATNRIKTENREEDESFSDVQSTRLSSASENSDWVRLSESSKTIRSTYRERRSESEESSDWHAVEDGDL
uniref:uncharacterized protein LOC122596624 n=1 Tax=Erigeron canadensis TaxID=72917 RepID=UPI001CB9BAC2|nr:uncharacterized protein LOC122596624 [Erigeron canadensis]